MNKRTLRTQSGKWIFSAIVIITVSLIFMLIHYHHQNHHQTQQTTATVLAKKQPNVVTKQMPWFANPAFSWTEIAVKRGDSLYQIFKSHHINYATLQKMLANSAAKKYLQQLKTGRIFYLHYDVKTKQLVIKYPIDDDRTLYIYSKENVFQSYFVNKPLTKHVLYKSATIQTTFAKAARKAGLTHAQIKQLSDIFAGDINFSRDIHPNDKFSILYNEYYWHGKKEKPGNIIAATFTNRGKTYTALRFTYPYNHSGYYTPDGHGVEPLFLRRPLKYKRISGRFTFHRYDPVLHIVHPHLGIDFAAPMGTKVKSIGNGKVIFHGRKGGYGNAVVIRFSRKYKALYGHLSRFAKGLRNGEIVKKGQVIGYVGSTGWSTGPHLHFEMYVYGVPHNPLKMKFVGGKSIPKDYLPAFHERADTLLAELKMYKGQEFAMVNQKKHDE